MSKQVDERVVSMQFDNKHFESNVAATMNSLDKLKEKLSFKDASKGFDEIDKAAKKTDMSPLAKSVETVRTRFSALEVMGVTALANITNSAVNAGKRIVSAFTIDPIKTGFQEYETQINAVQTILANTESKGSTLQDVNRALAELNTYADKTIYNFTEMTRNIGTFTAAGVDLKTSVASIKGIANLAAVSGSTSQQASTAMYQLSQALASGTVKLMDWNSVVNAGMGGQVFQDALKQTAKVHGVNIDAMIKKEGSFRETLKNGWLTSEILTDTLNQFTMAAEEGSEQWETYKKSLKDKGYTEEQAEAILKLANTATDAATKVKTFTQLFDTLKEAAQSGWTKSWEILIGDFEEAKNFLTDVSNRLGEIIGNSADSRNKMLSEGLSSGWKQLLNAGIADEEGFKDTFKAVAKEHGTAIDDMITAEKKLDDSLTDSEAFQKALRTGFSEGKVSADMLTESVHKMAEKMGKMSDKELEAAGYTEDHVMQIKALSSGLKDGSVSMDEFVQKISRTSGRENVIQALWNSFDGLMNILTPIGQAFRDVFKPLTGDQLYGFTESLVALTAKFKEFTEKYAPQIKSTFTGVFSVLKIGVTIIKSIVLGFVKLLGHFTGVTGGILDMTGALGDWIGSISKSITESNIFGKAIDGIVGFLGKGIDKIKEFKNYLSEKIDVSPFEIFLGLMKGIWDVVQRIGNAVGTAMSGLGKALAGALRSGDFKSLIDILNGGLFTGILLGIKKYITGITDKFDDAVGIVDRIKEVLGSVGDALKSWQQNLQAGTLQKIAISIGILAASLWVLSSIDPEKLTPALAALGTLFLELIGGLALFDKAMTKSKGLKGVSKAIPLMVGMSISVLILASAMKKLSDLSWNDIGKGLVGVAVLMGTLVGAVKLMSMSKGGIKKAAGQMLIMAVALKVLASVCTDLASLSWDQLGKGVLGIAGVLLAFVGFQALMKKVKPEKMLSSAFSLVIIGTAMKIFADVCNKLGQMEWGQLVKAGAAIGGILLIASGFSKLASYGGKMVSSSIALVLIGAAMEIFADVSSKFSQMEWVDLGKAGAAIGGILALAVGFAALAGLTSGMLKSVISLTIMAAAMEIFADVCQKFGQMGWEQLGKAGAAIGGILALAVGFAALAGLTNGILTSAAALLVMAVALRIFTPVLMTLGNMSLDNIVKGLISLAVGLGIFIGAAALINGLGLAPALFALGAAVALFGVACLAAGLGIMAFSAGLASLAVSGAAGATALVAAITIITTGILNLIPSIVNILTDAIVALCNVFIQSAPALGEAIKVLVVLLIDVFVQCIPQLAEGLLKMILGVLDALAQYTPQIVTKLFEIFIGIIESAAEALGMIDPETLLKGILAISGLMIALNAMASLAPGAMLGVLGFGAVIAELAIVLAAIGALGQIPGLTWLISEGGDLLQSIGTAIGQFVGGIIGGIAEGATSTMPQVGSNLSAFMTNLMPFIEGAKLLDETILNNVGTLTGIILALTGAGIIDAMTSWLTGGSSIVDFGAQLAAFAPHIVTFSDTVKNIDNASVTAAANAGKAMAEMAKKIPSDWGNNNLIKFGEQFADYGEVIVAFSTKVKGGVDLNSINAASEAGKALTGMAKTIPNDIGHNNLTKFGEQLVSFATSLVTFNTTVGGQTSGVAAAKSAIEDLISYLSNIVDTQSDKISNFTRSLSEVGQNGIKSFVESLAVPNETVDAALSAFLNSIISTVSGWTGAESNIHSQFQAVGNYAIDGFVAGLTSVNGLARVTAAGTKVGDYAYRAAKKAIDSNSPSKKFAELGLFSILGYAKGVKNNLKTVDESGRSIGTSVLTAFQDELQIHSPSVVMNKQGRYVVQGVAEGIKKDMSAEEAAEKKAQNICEAFQKVFDKFNVESSIAQNEFDLWKLTDGKGASSIEENYAYKKFLEGQLERDKKANDAAYDKWQQMLAHGFKEDSKEAKEAFNEFLETSKTVGERTNELRERTLQEWDDRADLAQKAIDAETSEYETWVVTEGKYADKATLYKRLRERLEFEQLNLKDIENRAKWKLEWLRDNAGIESEIAAAQEAYNTAIQNRVAKEDELKNLSYNELYGDKYEELDKNEEARDRRMANWEAKYGQKATPTERYNQEMTIAQEASNDAAQEWLLAQKEYISILVKKNRNQATIEELEAAKAKVTEAETKMYETANKHTQIKKDYIEEQRDATRDITELASEIAEHEYDVWEKTLGRKATDSEKDAKRLEIYARQLQSQQTIYNMALEDVRTAMSEYGSESQEYRDAYRNALQEEAALVNLQDEIMTTKEELAKRQKKQYNKQQLAMSEYKDYIKKYKQYYLENGLTMEDLERDAKAAANYDPTKTVETVVSKTSSALSDALSTSGALSLGSSYVEHVSAGMNNSSSLILDTAQNIISSCGETLSREQPQWLELGKQCMSAFKNGLTEATSNATATAAICAAKCANRIRNGSNLWSSAGRACVIGFANGLRNNVSIATSAAEYVAQEALRAANEVFEVHSPSKAFWNTAKYCVEGLAGGFMDNSNLSEVAAKSLAEDAVNSFTLAIQQITDAVDSELDAQPTIRPVLDLSNVERGVARLTNMFSRDQAIGISSIRNANSELENQNRSDSSGSEGKTINYVQNNYSPKALSPTDVYRRTKNQLSAMKGAL